ncbi:hypothetical protein ElyMa_002765600, partial [Elysia marginata]
VPTLDDIHKFCGGATGHKAASFGIRMGGKIKRASHHEKQFEEKAKRNDLNDKTADDILNDSTVDTTLKKRKKKKKKREEKDSGVVSSLNSELSKSKKTKKRKSKDIDLDSDTKDGASDELPMKKCKKKKKNKREIDVLENGTVNASECFEDSINGLSEVSDKNSSNVVPKKKEKDDHEDIHESGSSS